MKFLPKLLLDFRIRRYRARSFNQPLISNRSTTLLLTTFLLAIPSAYSQQIPKGVNYKKASESVNSVAKTNLERALVSSESVPPDLFGEVVVVGPLLWKALKPSAEQVLRDAKPIIMMAQVPDAVVAEGKRILTDAERKAFWKLLRAKYSKLKKGTVRKGKAEEISYYWATIPFDIEEPFWVIDVGPERFVAHFKVNGETPRLFWIDVVGDLRTLKP